MSDLEELKRLHAAATPAPWSVWDSNSFRRISHKGDGDVICGTIQRSDGHPDLYAKRADLDFLCELRNAFPAIVARLEAAQRLYKVVDRHSVQMPDEVLAALTACDFAAFDK